MLIKHEAVLAFQRRKLDDWNWIKQERRISLVRELRRMPVRPEFKTEPWLHQLACFYVGLYCPHFLFLLDMGLGKTKIILDLITHALREKKLRQALVIVPHGINTATWGDDIARHSNLEPELIVCSDVQEKWERLRNPRGELTVIDLPSLHLALTEKARRGEKGKGAKFLTPDEARVREVQKLYNFVAMDESHKLTNTEALWFRLCDRLTKHADFSYATTGTVFGKNVEMVWPQFYLVDRGETFGENKGLFRATFFTASKKKWGRGEDFDYDPRTAKTLHRMLQHRSLRYDENEVLDLPALVPRIERYVMGEEQRKHYMLALQGLIEASGRLEELKGAWAKMRRIISGYMTWSDAYGEHVMPFKDNPKLDGLESLLERCTQSAKAVVCCHYAETGRMIVERTKSLGVEWLYGGTKDPIELRRRFLSDPTKRVLVMNSEVGGTGTDGLQKVARYMFLYETPTSPITRRQVPKRIHRPGMEGRAFVYDLVMRHSLDGGILRELAENRDLYAAVVEGRTKTSRRDLFLADY